MACVPACPSGVKYDQLISAKRAEIEHEHRRPLRERALRGLVFQLFPYRRRLSVLKGPLWLYQRSGLARLLRGSRLYQRIPATVRALDAIAPPVTASPRIASRTPATGVRRGVVGVLTGCVQSTFFAGVNAATVRVLAAEGCDVVVPTAQGCCGALSAHNGRLDEARRFARGLIDTFEQTGVETIVVNSAGCGSTMKEYAELLHDDPVYADRASDFAGRTRDIAEFLDELGPVAPRHPLPIRVAYHDACHLSNAQGVRSQPRAVLAAIPGLTVAEIPDGHLCCGSAGIYNLLQPDAAGELGDRKAANIRTVGADVVVTANPGCLMQIGAALGRAHRGPIALAHTVEIVDASIRGLDPSTVTGLDPTPVAG
jgi:glycolate oxidase iron-sulfur subunit